MGYIQFVPLFLPYNKAIVSSYSWLMPYRIHLDGPAANSGNCERKYKLSSFYAYE